MRELLGLDPTVREVTIVQGSRPSSTREVAIETRSVLQVLVDLASYIDVPESDVNEGRVYAPSLLLVALVASVSFAVDAAPAAAKRRTGMVRGVYEPPEDPKYQPIYEQLRNDMALERFAEVLRAIRLAKPLVFKFAGCDATVNAWYEPPMAR